MIKKVLQIVGFRVLNLIQFEKDKWDIQNYLPDFNKNMYPDRTWLVNVSMDFTNNQLQFIRYSWKKILFCWRWTWQKRKDMHQKSINTDDDHARVYWFIPLHQLYIKQVYKLHNYRNKWEILSQHQVFKTEKSRYKWKETGDIWVEESEIGRQDKRGKDWGTEI